MSCVIKENSISVFSERKGSVLCYTKSAESNVLAFSSHLNSEKFMRQKKTIFEGPKLTFFM